MMNLKNYANNLGKKKYNYLCIDRSKKIDQGRYCISSECKNTYIDCTPETKLFSKQIRA